MGLTINSRILLSLASIAAAATIVVGGTFAFFSDTDISTGNTLTAGTLDIEITDQNSEDPFQGETIISNWAPGTDAIVNFDVQNDGTLPVNLRGFATGTWGNPVLDSENRVKVVKVERWDGASWVALMTNTSGITGYFYYSPNGLDALLYEVNPGEKAQLRLTVNFDENAGDAFQGLPFTASIQAEAKQVNDLVW